MEATNDRASRMTVHLEWRQRVALVTIDRPERRNALDHQTLLKLQEVLSEVDRRGARCLVLRGAPPAFCAGADLTGVENDEFLTALASVLGALANLPMTTVAAIDGPALGAGTQLAIACDLRVATPTSVFGIPAAKLGLAVDQWTIDRLSSEFGVAIARAMLLASKTYRADELAVGGAVQRLGDIDAALAWADELAKLAPITIAAHKLGLARDLGFERLRLAAWNSADATEGRTAFLEKRQAKFSGLAQN
jgi:enoyl-CoA hydratase